MSLGISIISSIFILVLITRSHTLQQQHNATTIDRLFGRTTDVSSQSAY